LPTHVRANLGLDSPNRTFDTLMMGKGAYDPGLAGCGVPFVRSDFNPTPLTLSAARPLPGGVVVLHYARATGQPSERLGA
jgi:hypothetical protein